MLFIDCVLLVGLVVGALQGDGKAVLGAATMSLVGVVWTIVLARVLRGSGIYLDDRRAKVVVHGAEVDYEDAILLVPSGRSLVPPWSSTLVNKVTGERHTVRLVSEGVNGGSRRLRRLCEDAAERMVEVTKDGAV